MKQQQMGEIARGPEERMRQSRMLDKARLARCCSMINDHNVIGYGFQTMSNGKDRMDFKFCYGF